MGHDGLGPVEPMHSFIGKILELQAKHKVYRRCDVSISPNAKVAFRGIASNSPGKLSIGDGSIFQGSIAYERPQSSIRIGNNTFIGRSLLVCADRIEIGDDVLIAWGCTIVDHNSHSIEWSERECDVKNYYRGFKIWDHVRIEPVKICDKVWIGFNSIILEGVTVNEGAVIGCGSVVTKDVPPYTVVAGNPARAIRSLR
jgi:acetyltransferase-like isoleucine patch superfamily enzyme